MKNVYLAKPTAVAIYGAGVWGHTKHALLQTAEDTFWKNLVGLPKCSSSYNCHIELKVPYISDQISLAPILLWHSIWRRDPADLTQQFLADCLALEHAQKIPWLLYSKNNLISLGLESIFKTPRTSQNI